MASPGKADAKEAKRDSLAGITSATAKYQKNYIEKIESEIKKLRQEKATAASVATLAEEKMKVAQQDKDNAVAAKARAESVARQATASQTALEDKIHALERRVADETESLQSASTTISSLQAQLDKESRRTASLEAQVGVTSNERSASDAAARRNEEQLRTLQVEHTSMLARAKGAEKRCQELQLALADAEHLKSDHTILRSEKETLESLRRRAEEESARLEKNRAELLEQIRIMEASRHEDKINRDEIGSEKARAVQMLALLQAEKHAVEEALQLLQQQSAEEKATLSERLASAEAGSANLLREKELSVEERAKNLGQLAMDAAEKRDLQKKVDHLLEERTELEARTHSAEQRHNEGSVIREAAVAERHRLEQEVAIARAERKRMDEATLQQEQTFKDLQRDKQALLVRTESAETRARDVLAMRDKVIEELSKTRENLATSQAEKIAAEELVRRCELQINHMTDERAALQARCDDLARQKDVEAHERSKLTMQLSVAHSEKCAIEEVLKLSEMRLGEERPALTQRAEFAERRSTELEVQRQALSRANEDLKAAVASQREAHNEAIREMAGLKAEKHGLETKLHSTEASLGDMRATVDAAEVRASEAVAERLRCFDTLTAAEAGRRGGEEILNRMSADIKSMSMERSQLLERVGAAEEKSRQAEETRRTLAACQSNLAALQQERAALAQEVAVAQTELRGKELVARHLEQKMYEEKLALQSRVEVAEERVHEAHAGRNSLQDESARLRESYENLLDDHRNLGAVVAQMTRGGCSTTPSSACKTAQRFHISPTSQQHSVLQPVVAATDAIPSTGMSPNGASPGQAFGMTQVGYEAAHRAPPGPYAVSWAPTGTHQ